MAAGAAAGRAGGRHRHLQILLQFADLYHGVHSLGQYSFEKRSG